MTDQLKMFDITKCQAVGCNRAPLDGAVRLVLDPSRPGGLDVYVCDQHRLRLREWAQKGAKAAGQDWRHVDQEDET